MPSARLAKYALASIVDASSADSGSALSDVRFGLGKLKLMAQIT